MVILIAQMCGDAEECREQRALTHALLTGCLLDVHKQQSETIFTLHTGFSMDTCAVQRSAVLQ